MTKISPVGAVADRNAALSSIRRAVRTERGEDPVALAGKVLAARAIEHRPVEDRHAPQYQTVIEVQTAA